MGTEKRARQKAGRQARLAAQKAEQARTRRRRTILRVGLVALAVAGVFLGLTLSGRDDEAELDPDEVAATEDTVGPIVGDAAAEAIDEVTGDSPTAADGPTAGEATGDDGPTAGEVTADDMIGDEPIGATTVPATEPDAAPEADGRDDVTRNSDEAGEDAAAGAGEAGGGGFPEGVAGADYTPYGSEEYGEGECAPAGGADEPVLDFAGAPALCIDTSAPHTAVFDTSRGTVRVALDVTNTPGTVNSFVNLARFGYYDGTLVHRSDQSIGILQGGSPHTNDAADPGPGYTLWDEGTGFTYRPGQFVMARTGAPNSAGAQYFFTVTEAAGLLDGQGIYVVFGEVVEGLDLLTGMLDSHVDDPANPLGGAPDPPVVVNSVTIEVG
ncbi:MAG: peptidylprolyl isomerase [bacterium]|nr:peptidylprolyl isomerase [bacterium]